MLKTHSCGQLRRTDIGSQVVLAGWVHRRRDHGGLIFIDLRDREGVVQIVFNPQKSPEPYQLADELRNEYVIRIWGEVVLRPEGTENPALPTGEIEVLVERMEILNKAETPPFYINKDVEVDENLRLEYRYLDLRRERMQRNIKARHLVVNFMREFLNNKGFLEVETPILIKSTPEGARDYLVPSRLYPGSFYALPQSPQQLKQLLMVAGFEKYYQIAKCFRDEDTRADRQPEFTQLDIEMSFVEEDDVMLLTEELLTRLVESFFPDYKLKKPFPRIRYAEAMARYGSDKPDIRFGLEMSDLSDILVSSSFPVFSRSLANGGCIKGIALPGCGDYSRRSIDELTNLAKDSGGGGLVTISLDKTLNSIEDLTMSAVKSSAARYLTAEEVRLMAKRLGASVGDLILILAGDVSTVNRALGALRLEMGRRLGLARPGELAFAFVVDFPLFSWNQELGRWESMHHPFTSPREEDLSLLGTAPEKVRGRHYDIVLNGYEIGGGSIRIHKGNLQREVFHILGYEDKEIDDLFGHLIKAFNYGAPPHGGIALGIDRLLMILLGEETIRDVIAFPKNQNARDLLFGSPAPVKDEQLKELHLRLETS
jgi:aspartyl-tRNA synthetase